MNALFLAIFFVASFALPAVRYGSSGSMTTVTDGGVGGKLSIHSLQRFTFARFVFVLFFSSSSFPWRSHSNNGALGSLGATAVASFRLFWFFLSLSLFFSPLVLFIYSIVCRWFLFNHLGITRLGHFWRLFAGRKILTIFSIIDSSSLPGFVQVGSLFAPTTQFSSLTIGFSTKPETGSAIFPVRNETWKTVSVLSPRLLINNTTVEPQPRL